MSGIVFRNTLWRSWRAGLYWAIGIALLGAYALIVIPNVDMLQQYADLIANMPPVMLQLFGASDAAAIASPEGFLGFAFFSYTLILLTAYGVACGLNVSANEEDRGILDVVLSLPIPRWRLVVERLLAYTVVIVLILALTFLTMWGILLTNDTFSIDTLRLFEGIANLLPSTLLVLAFTALAGALLRSRGMAMAVAAGFVVISYFINFIGSAASGTAAANLKVLSFFNWYDGGNIMTTGLQWGSVLLLSAVALILAAGSLWFFERRDIGV